MLRLTSLRSTDADEALLQAPGMRIGARIGRGGRALRGRASRERGLITSQTRAEPSGIDRVAAKERVTRGWSSSHPAHATRTHTSNNRTHGRHRGSNMPMSRQDWTLVRAPSAPPLGHMTGRRRDSRTSVTLALSRSTAAVARPSAMAGPPCAGAAATHDPPRVERFDSARKVGALKRL